MRVLAARSLCVAAALWLALSPALAQQPERAPVSLAATRASLVLIPGAEATQALAAHRPAAISAGSPAEAELLRQCADGQAQRPQAERGFLWSVATLGWRVFLHPLAVSVHEELQKYAKVSAGARAATTIAPAMAAAA